MSDTKRSCVVPVFVEFTPCNQANNRIAKRCSINETTQVVDTTEAIDNRTSFIAKNNYVKGYTFSHEVDYATPHVRVNAPWGGKFAVHANMLIAALTAEDLNISKIPFKIGFHKDDILLVSEKFLDSEIMAFELEKENALNSPISLEIGKVYTISQCKEKSQEIENVPMRYLGEVGDEGNKRPLLYHPNGWLVQCGPDVRFRAAPDKESSVKTIPSARRTKLALDVLELASNAVWYNGETFKPDTRHVSTFSSELLSHMYGSLLIENGLSINTTDTSCTTPFEFCFGRGDVLQFKTESYRDNHERLKTILGKGTQKGRTHNIIYTKECSGNLRLTDTVETQIECFHEALKEAISLKLDFGTQGKPSSLVAVYNYRKTPAYMTIPGSAEAPLRYVGNDLLWLNVV